MSSEIYLLIYDPNGVTVIVDAMEPFNSAYVSYFHHDFRKLQANNMLFSSVPTLGKNNESKSRKQVHWQISKWKKKRTFGVQWAWGIFLHVIYHEAFENYGDDLGFVLHILEKIADWGCVVGMCCDLETVLRWFGLWDYLIGKHTRRLPSPQSKPWKGSCHRFF